MLLQNCSPPVGVPTRTSYTVSVASSTAWTRSPRTYTALRGAGKSEHMLSRRDGVWILRLPGAVELVLDGGDVPNLDAAIEQADLVSPPEEWEPVTADRWTRGEWACVRGEDGWHVEHPRGPFAQRFASCDRARKWVDLRADRPGGLRGPRLRAAVRAERTLPDVRVTAEEREHAMQLARSLGLTFADFLRSAIRVMDELHGSGELHVRVRSSGDSLLELAARGGNARPSGTHACVREESTGDND